MGPPHSHHHAHGFVNVSHGLQVLAVKADLAKIQLTQPVCTQEEEKIALSRRVDKHWRCVGRRPLF